MDFEKIRPKIISVLGEQIFQNIILAAQLEETNKENRELKVELENMKGGNK